MRFDSDSPTSRLPYSGRHRKEPSYLRAVRHLRLLAQPAAEPAHTHAVPATPPVALRIVTASDGE
jgi:hypothetical protein